MVRIGIKVQTRSNPMSRQRITCIRILICFLALLLVSGIAHAQDAKPLSDDKLFSEFAAPVFEQHCTECHGATKPKSRLDLTSLKSILKGAASGPVIEPGRSNNSLLVKLVQKDAKPHMPPKGQLSDEEIASLTKWINSLPKSQSGSNEKPVTETDRQHWSFLPLANHLPPPIQRKEWPRTTVDDFILAKLEAGGLQPAPPATRADLIRRVTFDLTGLPVTQEETQAFVLDPSPFAYEKVVDRLLASPHYGERWGRHWLDLARYADSDGFEYDNDRPLAFRYRDYVVRSFNADKPYDQFLREQLAGDELAPYDPDSVIATGFCRHGPTVENQKDEKTRIDEIDDIVSTTSSVFLGLTIGCARCHDHKYDPIRQQDYYRLLAIFNNREKREVPVSNPAEKAVFYRDFAFWEVEMDRLQKQLTQVEGQAKQNIERQLQEHKQRQPQQPLAMAIQDSGRVSRPTFFLLRGNVLTPGAEIEPAVPTVLTRLQPDFSKVASGLNSTGRRSVLAKWISDPQNPLTARVWANRVWQYHFGKGLVESSSNFGLNGAAPTHPELLDWLAQQLISDGWQLKPLHRQIVLSATYCQSTQFNPMHSQADSGNSLLWRFSPRRLSAEEIRDCILAASGSLNLQMFGPGIRPRVDPNFIAISSTAKWPVVEREGPDLWRRSLYIFVKRSVFIPLLEAFDATPAQQSCERRLTTTVATQALQMLNDPFTNQHSALLSQRIWNSAGPDRKAQVIELYGIALSRKPNARELERGIAFLKQQFDFHHQTPDRDPEVSRQLALTDLCHVMLNLNEFIFVN
jgi:mono/diheme cytochrome c family protein